MTGGEKKRWAVGRVVLAGMAVGAGVCGVEQVRPASAEPVPLPLPQLPKPDPAVAPAGVVPPAPVIALPTADPPKSSPAAAVTKRAAALLAAPPEQVELLPPPAAEKMPDPPKPAIEPPPIPVPVPKPVAELPSVALPVPKPLDVPTIDAPKLDPPKLDAPKIDPPKFDVPAPPAATKPSLPPLPPAETTLPTLPVKSAHSPGSPPTAPPDLSLRASEPRLNVNSVGQVPPAVPVPPVGAPDLAPTTPPPGDAAMPMSLRKTALSAALGATLVSAPLSAQDNTKKDADKGTPSSTTQTVKAEDLEKLRQDLADVRDAIRGKRADGYTVKGLAERVEELEKKLDSIEKLLIGIDNKLTTRTAGSSPIGGGAGDAVGTTGTVKVVNEYPSQISIVVNDKSAYRVEPNETKTITVPAGTFKYQLLRQSEVNRAIKAGETVTLWVR